MSICMVSQCASGLTDREVVARIQAGEMELYGVLAERHNRRFHRMLRSILRNPEDIEDVLQQAHLNAVQHVGRFEGRSTFLTWLSRIVINEAYTHLRRRRNCEPLDLPDSRDEDRPKQFTAKDPSPEQTAICKQLRDMLDSAVASLPEPYRAVIAIRTMRGLPTIDAASSLGLSEQGVKTRLLRATRLLRRKMQANLQVPN
jgi:RNA polymerase sigma-70 factor (ECF subfamily)